MKETLLEAVGGVVFVVSMAALIALYCAVTPDQLSGEADWTRAEAERK